MSENPLSQIKPWDLVADGYVTEIAPVFEKWADDSFKRVNLEKHHRVLDVATGPGTVAVMLAPLVKEIVALDFSEQMISHLQRIIDEKSITNIQTRICDCQKLPYEGNSFDFTFSQFGLMFFPDRMAGFKEMFRVLKPNGSAVVYSWAPISKSPAMLTMFGALQAGFPETKPKEGESNSIIKGLDDKETFELEMEKAGFSDITIEPIVHSFPVEGPDEYWDSMVKGSAPVTLLKSSMPKDEWKKKELITKQYLKESLVGITSLSSTAYLGIGIKPE